MAKYKPESNELTSDSIKSFVEDYLTGKLEQHLLSQDLPEDKETVKVLEAGNFDSVVFDADKDVLVEFYAPWCGHCNQLVPIYDKVGEYFKDNKNVVIAKIDATVNELEHTEITSFPTLILYPKGGNDVTEYTGPRTVEGLTKFIESGGVDGAGVKKETDSPRKDDL